ncbi:MAG: hypothetical protein IT328_20735 [Caldilineaceae bacterium]|nr:hypothetical protein [Caldilineaceae bacterium]
MAARTSSLFRLLSVATLMAALFLNSPRAALAQTTTSFVLLPSSTTIAPGSTFNVDVKVESGGEQIVLAELHLDFDPAVLQVTNVTVPSGMPLTSEIIGPPAYDNDGPNNDGAKGTVDYVAAKLGTPFPTTDFVLLNIEFQVKAGAALGDTQLTFFNTTPRKTRITSPAGDTLDAAAPLTLSVIQANIAPTANAGADQTVTDNDNNGSEQVTLDGSLSSDSDGTIVSYVWSEGATELGTGATLNHNFPVGTHTVLLTVTDDEGATGTDTVVITVEAAAPVVGTVDMVIAPATTQTYVGATFTVAVEVQAGSQPVNGAEVYLTFDPALLEVQSIVKGSTLPTYVMEPVYNNTAGTFSAAAGKLGAPFPTGTFNLLSITFKAKAASVGTPLTMLRATPTESKVTSDAAVNVLDQLVNGTVEISNLASIQGTVELQGRPAKPNAAWILPLTVQLYTEGATTPAYTFAPTTNNNGQFTVDGITPGLYTAAVKGATTLQVVEQVTLIPGPNAVNFGLLLAGNADNNNQIDLVDFSILSLTFNKSSGQSGYDGRADFNGNGAVTLEDFSLLAINFNTAGESVPGVIAASVDEQEATAGTVQMRLSPSSSQVALGDQVTLEVVMDAADQPVSGAEVHLDFDPTLLKVISVTPGELYETTLVAPRFNNDDGTLDYAAGRLEGEAPRGEVVVLSVLFEAVGEGETEINFANAFPRQSQAAYAGESLLGATIPAQITVGTEVTGEKPATPALDQHIFLPRLSGQ